MKKENIFIAEVETLFNDSEINELPLIFREEEHKVEEENDFWKILIVDDEKDIHTITEIVLNSFVYLNKKVKILNAYSAKEAIDVLKENPDIAIVLLDVVMETTDAGLKLVKIIREDIGHLFVRIILRTGQPGYAPESDVITKYDINDYQTKTDLTHERLLTVVLTALRAYHSIITIDTFRQDLDKKVKERTQELEEANQQLQEQNRQIESQRLELEKLNASKNKFFSIIAHDLKSPFFGILLLSELLANNMNEFTQEDVSECAKNMYEAAQNYHKLLQNLLDWSMAQMGAIEFTPELIRLEDLFFEIVSMTQNSSQAKNIDLSYELDDNMTIYADKNMLNTIIRNLVSNAVKYTNRDGKVLLSASNLKEGVRISITDNGVGINEEKIDQLFNLGIKSSTLGTDNEPGTGLGLILCQEFAEKHRTKIGIESKEGEGTTFYFTLPSTEDGAY